MEEEKNLEFHSELKAVPFEGLNSQEMNLIHKAIGARDRSHSPYSNFKVGAAILMANGQVVLGANQENAAYPSGLCAERVAMFSAGVEFPKERMEALAVCVDERATNLPFPCGGCLQVMSEYEFMQKESLKLYLIHPTKELVYTTQSTRDLLPFSFNESHLPD